jgi:uncharacterized protein (TIGR00375 family)
MNWRLSGLDKYSLVSFSDSHSYWPWRMGREATCFDLKELSYDGVIKAMKTREGLVGTIEVEPGYGKYHMDGHRNCGVVMEPGESRKNRNVCPKCGRPLTIGVLHRVEELADREDGFVPKDAVPFKSIIPLSEIISSVMGIKQVYSKKVWDVYNKLVGRFGSEFGVMLDAPPLSLKEVAGERMASVLMANREGKICVEPGYDGVYGQPVFGKGVRESLDVKGPCDVQRSIMDFGND